MDERLQFIARLLEGEKMAPLCREFGISRVAGYKIHERYKEYRKKQPGERYVWGVLRMDARKQNFRTAGEKEGARRKAKRLANQLNRMEAM